MLRSWRVASGEWPWVVGGGGRRSAGRAAACASGRCLHATGFLAHSALRTPRSRRTYSGSPAEQSHRQRASGTRDQGAGGADSQSERPWPLPRSPPHPPLRSSSRSIFVFPLLIDNFREPGTLRTRLSTELNLIRAKPSI